MDQDTQNLIDALKYFSADRTKSLQTKLTKTANAIEKDGLSVELRTLLSDDEQATLAKAANILRSIKGKVEHAKEIKQREEARQQAAWDARQARILTHCNTLFPDPQNHDDCRTLLLWRLSLSVCWRGYFVESNYYPEIQYVEQRLMAWGERRWRDDQGGRHIFGAAREWRGDLINTLKDMMLWWPAADADQAPMGELSTRFQEEWKPLVESRYADLLQRFDTEVVTGRH